MRQTEPKDQTQMSSDMPSQLNHGAHELMDTHEAVGCLISAMEHYVIYADHTSCQELLRMNKNQQQFLNQMYNTIVDTLKTGEDPAVSTQVYQMEQANDITYGLEAGPPKSPAQSTEQINDECISGFMLGQQKAVTTSLAAAALEATNPVMRRVLADSIPNTIEMAYELFLYQNKNAYYQVPQFQTQDMQMLSNQFSPVTGDQLH